jgi:redox-sensitive bicupin YhaK (pirin superfamily)
MRTLTHLLPAQPTHDGDGVKIHRLAGRQLNALLNPFLMIDEINSDDASDYIGGFPEHPHRGFETITYMKAGRMRHRDHMGNEGVISAGDIQWMTAGAGVLHSEMPEQEHGLLHGFQIWLNLPAAEKMKPADYKEILSKNITEQPLPNDGLIRVIAGNVTFEEKVLQGALPEISTQPVFLDVKLAANQTIELDFNNANTAMVYVYKGSTDDIDIRQLGIYASGKTLKLQGGSQGSELLVLSGRDINEPLVQYGPFVMNTTQEIKRAIADFQNPQFLSELTDNR